MAIFGSSWKEDQTSEDYSQGREDGRKAGFRNGIELAQKVINLSKEVPHELKIKLWEYLEELKGR